MIVKKETCINLYYYRSYIKFAKIMKKLFIGFSISLIIFVSQGQILDCQRVKFSIGAKKYGQEECICDEQHVWKNQQCVKLIELYKEAPSGIIQQNNIKRCSKGFFLNKANQVCLKCQDYSLGCQQCLFLIQQNDQKIACSSCLPFFYIQNSECIKCSLSIPNCYQCSSKDKCKTCTKGYQVNPLNKSQCLKKPPCNVQNCELCNTNNADICLQCRGIYSLSLKKDSCKPTICHLGLNFLGKSCGCRPGNIFIEGSCVDCPQNCITCKSANVCSVCQKGYSLAGGQCISCSDLTWQQKCQKCSGALCLDCFQGYSLVGNSCRLNQLGRQGFYLNNSMSFSCSQGCKSCVSQHKCLTCLKGYGYFKQNCYRCEQNCSNCYYDIIDQNSICIQCFSGYSLQLGGTCAPCLDKNCRYCSDQQFCITCQQGFTSVNGICLKCAENCIFCQQSGEGQCDNAGCEVGFGIIKSATKYNNNIKTCIQCIIGCNKCDQNVLSCQGCLDGYFNQTKGNKTMCTICRQGCQTCQDTNYCLQCKFGYSLSEGICLSNCKRPCSTCDLVQFKCKACFAGYILDHQQQCQPDLQCNKTSSCLVCPQGFIKKKDTCQPCFSLGTNCIACSQINPNLCVKCQMGYYLKKNQCMKCSINCKNCVNENYCYQAAIGSFIQNEQSGIVKDCSNNCKTCQKQSTRCTSCSQQFYLQSSYCQSYKKIFFQMKLGGRQLNLAKFQQMLYSFVAQLTQSLDIDKNSLRFQKFWQGSVNIILYISIKGNQNQKQLLLKAQSISILPIIGEQDVQNCLVMAVGFSPEYKLKIIYGIWIPFTLISLSLLVIMSCFYSKKKENYLIIHKLQQEQQGKYNLQI